MWDGQALFSLQKEKQEVKRIYLIDYIGDSLKSGKLVGHPVNVGNQYVEMLKKEYEINCIAPQNECSKLDCESWISLRHNAIRGEKGKFQIVKNYLAEYLNLCKVWRGCDKEDILFFFNTDYVLYLFLAMHGKRKVICCTYTCIIEENKNLSWVIKKMLLGKMESKISLFLYSNRYFDKKVKNKLYVPDFLYREEFYDKYAEIEKLERVICVGTMSEGAKDLVGMVKTFNAINYPLRIVGQFFEKNVYDEIMRIKKQHIEVENRFVSNEEYFSLIASSKYTILPYRVQNYKHKTSGVILEAMFVGSVPIAPNPILDINDIRGIGYDELENLEKVDLKRIDAKKFRNCYKHIVQDTYSYEKSRDNIIEEVKKVENSK